MGRSKYLIMMNILPGNNGKFSVVSFILGLTAFAYYLLITQVWHSPITRFDIGFILFLMLVGIYFTLKTPNQKDKL